MAKAQLSMEAVLMFFLVTAMASAFYISMNRILTGVESQTESDLIYPEEPPQVARLQCYTDHGFFAVHTDLLRGNVNYRVETTNGTRIRDSSVDVSLNGSGKIYFGASMDRDTRYSVRLFTPKWSVSETCTARIHEHLVSRFLFDEGTGNLTYDAESGVPARLYGLSDGAVTGASWSPGAEGTGMGFSGGDEYVLIVDDGTLSSSDITLSLWVKGQAALFNRSQNLLSNPGFESGATCNVSGPPDWTHYASEAENSCWEVNDVEIHSGNQSFGNDYDCDLVCTSFDNGSASIWPNIYVRQNVSVSDLDAVAASAWIKVAGDPSGCGTCEPPYHCILEDDARIHLYAYDSAGALIGEFKGDWGGDKGFSSGWNHFKEVWNVPNGTHQVTFQVDGGDYNSDCCTTAGSEGDYDECGGGNAGLFIDDTRLSGQPSSIIYKNNSYGMGTNGTFIFGFIGGQNVSTPKNTTAQWTHLVMTYNTTSLSLYVDGNKSVQVAYEGGFYSGQGDMIVGRGTGDYLEGTADELRIYDRTLNETEVQQLYTGQDIRHGLTGYWAFEEGLGTTARDTHMWATGKDGTALCLDGNDYAIFNGSTLDGGFGGLTIMTWTLVHELDDSWNRIVSLDDSPVGSEYAALFYDADSFYHGFYVGTGGQSATPEDMFQEGITTGRWLKMAGTYDGSTARYYEDGELKLSYPLSGTIKGENLTLGIGVRADGNTGDAMQGLVEELRIYDAALEKEQIDAIFSVYD